MISSRNRLVLALLAGCALAGAAPTAGFDEPACTVPDAPDFPLRGTDRYEVSLVHYGPPALHVDAIVSLGRQGSVLYGSYVYKKIGTLLRLRGCVDSRGRFALEETDLEGAVTGRWVGRFEDPPEGLSSFEGLWSSAVGRRQMRFFSHTLADRVTSGLDCVGTSGEMMRVEDGGFEPLPAERIPEVTRIPLVPLGPYDRKKYGLDRAQAGLLRSCETRESDRGGETREEQRCDTELVLGIEAGEEIAWWVRKFEHDWATFQYTPWPFRVTEAAAPSNPRIVLTDEIDHVANYATGTTTAHRLIELDGGQPRMTCVQRCDLWGGGRDWNGRSGYSQHCKWDPVRTDFLCREESGYSPLWAKRTGFREFWLESGAPRFGSKPGESRFRNADAFLEALARDPALPSGRVVIDSIGEVTSIETLRLEGGRRVRIFGAPQRETEPGARFFAAHIGFGENDRWVEIPSARFRYDRDDRYCHDGELALYDVPEPEPDAYTPEESEYRFSSRKVEAGVAGLHLLQVVAEEAGWDGESGETSRSVYWIAVDERQPGTVDRAVLLTTEAINGGSGLDTSENRFARVIEIRRDRPDRLATFLVTPPTSVDVLAPRDRISNLECPCPQMVGLTWAEAGGFEIERDDTPCTEADRGFEEPDIGVDGEILPRRLGSSLAEQVSALLEEDGLGAAIERLHAAVKRDSEDRKRFDVVAEINLVATGLLSQDRPADAVAVIEPLGKEGLPVSVQTLLDAGQDDRAVDLVHRNWVAIRTTHYTIEDLCEILAAAGRLDAAIKTLETHLHRTTRHRSREYVRATMEKIRRWKEEEGASPH